jgi:hypothetical protein
MFQWANIELVEATEYFLMGRLMSTPNCLQIAPAGAEIINT